MHIYMGYSGSYVLLLQQFNIKIGDRPKVTERVKVKREEKKSCLYVDKGFSTILNGSEKTFICTSVSSLYIYYNNMYM